VIPELRGTALNNNIHCIHGTSYIAGGNTIKDFTFKMKKIEANYKAFAEFESINNTGYIKSGLI
jgi:hypothetical protein